ncbi:hypothetical protein [Streptomyces humi]|uniref:hypothetical protein n=1 Tax=Streptomyces humi TaxID=1428620 RepID=UPI0006286D31|nr:hypothetical protein [Streptomyces humi]
MTQSGQGEPAREGIVLPSDGGEPLLPGMTGGSGRPVQPPATAPAPATAPTEGQSWGQPWGPDHQNGHQNGHQQGAAQPQQSWPQAAGQEWGTPDQPSAWNGQSHTAHTPGAGPLPPEAASAAPYGGGYEQSYGGGYGTPPQQQSYGAPLPPAAGQDPYGAPGAALPPAVPHANHGGHGGHPGALPSADEGATQYIPPVPAAPVDEGATQYIPPVAAAPDGATQLIPPVGPGALPPENSHEQTAFLGRQPAPAAHSDADATQYIAPYQAGGPQGAPGADRQPPAEFDNLFRSGPGGEPPAASTAQLPRFQQQPQPGYTPPPPPPSYDRYDDAGNGGGRGGRTRSKVPLIAAVGIGIAVLGIGAGALLGGGGDKSDDNKTVAASASASEDSSAAAADPAKAQAVALDKLLADSGSSRATVISAVASVKQCDNLGGSASDLRNAAKQRTELVTRLSKLSVDKLPNNAELTASLTKAWQASANADNHYAAWADQAGGKHGCKKGQARATGQTAAGNRESGTASSQKVKAAGLWNTIASKYGLTQRQPTQL